MKGKRLIEKIRLRNILSFGDKGKEITLEPLNIIDHYLRLLKRKSGK